ncbi:MAG: class I SAM-dependent methyltransferase [Candidatus Devosia euplotis]|nr:class I SAM-dependent methyltransferase [Candidatus Devosia euplotis]
MHAFNPSIELHGIDRSEGQLDTLRGRRPDLSATVGVVDLTDSNATLPLADLTYSHAVLMHISETRERFNAALRNVLRSAKRHVVMIDNWTEHDFLAHIQKNIVADSNWADATISFATFRGAPELTALILSKDKVPYPELLDYDSLLQEKALRTH